MEFLDSQDVSASIQSFHVGDDFNVSLKGLCVGGLVFLMSV